MIRMMRLKNANKPNSRFCPQRKLKMVNSISFDITESLSYKITRYSKFFVAGTENN